MNAYEVLTTTAVNTVIINDGPLVNTWMSFAFNGSGRNKVIMFSCKKGRSSVISLTEDSINNGAWKQDGRFHCKDSNGKECVIEMFITTRTRVTPENAKRVTREATEC